MLLSICEICWTFSYTCTFSADHLINFCAINNYSSVWLQLNTLKSTVKINFSYRSATLGNFHAQEEC